MMIQVQTLLQMERGIITNNYRGHIGVKWGGFGRTSWIPHRGCPGRGRVSSASLLLLPHHPCGAHGHPPTLKGPRCELKGEGIHITSSQASVQPRWSIYRWGCWPEELRDLHRLEGPTGRLSYGVPSPTGHAPRRGAHTALTHSLC